MKYERNWISVEEHLAKLWIDAPDRQAVTDAADEMDRLLSTDAYTVGEGRDGNTRVLFVLPLGIFFDVSEADRSVVIWRVWRYSS